MEVQRLNVDERVILKSLGMDARQFLLIKKTADNLKLWHRQTQRVVDVRY